MKKEQCQQEITKCKKKYQLEMNKSNPNISYMQALQNNMAHYERVIETLESYE